MSLLGKKMDFFGLVLYEICFENGGVEFLRVGLSGLNVNHCERLYAVRRSQKLALEQRIQLSLFRS